MSIRTSAITCALFALFSATFPASAQKLPYDITVVGGADSQQGGLNNLGTVGGRDFSAGFSTYRAFVNTGTGPVDIGTLGGVNSWALGVNDAGQVAGSADNAAGQSRAFLYEKGSMTDLGTLGGSSSQGFAINAAGVVVGSSFTAPTSVPDTFIGLRAFMRPPGGTLQDLGTLPGFIRPFSQAYAINDNGQIAGRSGQAGSNRAPTHPFLYDKGTMTDLGSFGGVEAAAFGINDRGQVVGASDLPAPPGSDISHAFLYADGVLTDLNPLLGGSTESVAYDINNLGQIVGGAGGLGAFVMQGKDVASLNTLVDPAWRIEQASAINDAGQIAATGVYGGIRYAVLLTPVPEPAVASMLGLGLGLLALLGRSRARRRRTLQHP
jgi:probable HAF family extracellular repeat protein